MLIEWRARLATTARALGLDRRAQDLIEYALLAGFVAVAVATFFPTSIAPNITTIFSKLSVVLSQTPG